MSEAQMIRIPVDGGEMGAYLAGLEGKRPGIVILHEIFGVNMAMRAEADELAAEGYVVCVPDLFHRNAPGTALSYEPEDRPTALALWEQLDADTEGALNDIARAVEYLAASGHCDSTVGLVGFCLGGKLALLAAARGISDAAVSFYPVQMQKHREALGKIACPVQVQLGDADTHIPTDVVDTLAADIKSLSDGEMIVHKGAGHAFYNRFRTVGYDEAAAADARAKMLDFLARTIARSGAPA